MATKADVQEWIIDAVTERGGSASPIEVAQYIWREHEDDLRGSGDLFYTWQYDMRWEAQKLRDAGRLAAKDGERRGTWDAPRTT